MKANIRVGAGLATLACLLGGLTAHGAPVTVRIQNAASTYLTLYGVPGGYVSTAFGGYNTTQTTLFELDDTRTYYLGSYFHTTAGTHPFTFSGGEIVPGGNAPETSEFFTVSGNNIYVHGIKFSVRFISSPNNDPYQYVQFGAGGLNAPTIAAWLGGPTVVAGELIPADGNFDGVYSLFFSGPTPANSATLTLGHINGIADLVGTGTSFVPSGHYSILATLSNGNVFEFTAVPEPSTLAMLVLTTVAVVRWRMGSNR